jgi:membrane associated rhomboid family serine protease
VASIATNNWKVEPFSVNPMIGPSAQTLLKLGAKSSPLIVQENEIWRLISAMVLHAGLIHYVINMLALWFIGSAVEQCHGFFSSMLLFVAPALGGTLLSAIFLPEYITVGASAGIFGLIGACLADIFLNWGLLFNEFVNGDNKQQHTVVLLVLFLDIVVNCVVGLTPFVDNFARKFYPIACMFIA